MGGGDCEQVVPAQLPGHGDVFAAVQQRAMPGGALGDVAGVLGLLVFMSTDAVGKLVGIGVPELPPIVDSLRESPAGQQSQFLADGACNRRRRAASCPTATRCVR